MQVIKSKLIKTSFVCINMGPKRAASKANDGDKEMNKKVKSTQSVLPENWYENSKSKMFPGAHVSAAGGVSNAVIEAAAIGARSFAMFLANQRTYNLKPLDDEEAELFKVECKRLGFPLHLILPHGSYLMNPGSPDPAILSKSRALMLDGMKRCEKLGIQLYNFHPGSTVGKCTVDECIKTIAGSINYCLEKTKGVTAVIENMCRQGNTVGGRFEEIKKIIDLVEDKTRVGVCFDTCHGFAAGYDIRSDKAYQGVWADFDRIIGPHYLKALHLNDSKGGLGDHLDRHENLGVDGKIGMKFFNRLMNDPRFKDMPLILETPTDDVYVTYAEEITTLMDLVEEEKGPKKNGANKEQS